jgi:hypothetical protein
VILKSNKYSYDEKDFIVIKSLNSDKIRMWGRVKLFPSGALKVLWKDGFVSSDLRYLMKGDVGYVSYVTSSCWINLGNISEQEELVFKLKNS